MIRPEKPHPDFPLSANLNGQWWKKVNQKPYYFGSWKTDPKGEAALREYNDRIAGILAGTDHLRALEAKGGVATVGGMMKLFLEQFRLEVAAGTRAKGTLGDYINELATFTEWVKPNTAIAALKPEHFAGYVKHLLEVRQLKSRARKRVQAYIKAMFRWAAGNGHAPLPNFGSAFKAPSTTKQAIRKEKARAGIKDYADRIVTGAEVDKLIGEAQPNFKAMILLGVNCGLGPADLGRLRWRHIQGRKLIYPRGKNGNERVGWLWKKTVAVLEVLKTLKHTRAAIERDGEDALVFITRKQQPYFWEEERKDANGKLKIVTHNAISITVGRMAVRLELHGVTHYRLRHTFKTLGKKARDRDALNLCMGHQTNTVQDGYDHEDIAWKRIKRVVRIVRHRLWPELRRRAGSQEQPQMRIVGGDQGDAAVRKAG
jgi:integrase